MKFKRIKNIWNNFECYWCGNKHYYSPEYIRYNVYCEYCQNKKSFMWKLIEKLCQ